MFRKLSTETLWLMGNVLRSFRNAFSSSVEELLLLSWLELSKSTDRTFTFLHSFGTSGNFNFDLSASLLVRRANFNVVATSAGDILKTGASVWQEYFRAIVKTG